MNSDILRGSDGNISVQRTTGTAVLDSDRHLDGNESAATLARLHPFTQPSDRKPSGKVCDCTNGPTVRRGSGPPRICITCLGFADRGLPPESYRVMRNMVGLEEPGLSDEVLNQIAAQIAERIGEQMPRRLAQMTAHADELLQTIDAKLADGASKTNQGGA